MRMHITTAALLIAGVTILGIGIAPAQDAPSPQNAPIRVRTLTLVSSDLADTDRNRISQALQGESYLTDELAERVRQALRDVGFYKANVAVPQLAGIDNTTEPHAADVSIHVTAGAQYRLAEIRFEGASLFSKDQLVYTPEQLRAQFQLEPRTLFNATAIGRGLDRVRDLYLSKGYADFGALPKPEIDELHHTIGLTIEIDKGPPYYFGRLLLNGTEPRAGDAKNLEDAWMSMQSRPHNPQILAGWLAKNAPYWPDTGESMQHIATAPNRETQLIDIQLKLP